MENRHLSEIDRQKDLNYLLGVIIIWLVIVYSFHNEIDSLLSIDNITKNGERLYYFWFIGEALGWVLISVFALKALVRKSVAFVFFGLSLNNFLDELIFKPVGVNVSEYFVLGVIMIIGYLIHRKHDTRSRVRLLERDKNIND